MQGPSLTPREAVATLARRVRSLEAQGADHDAAIQLASVQFGVEPHKVRWFVDQDSAVPVAQVKRHRGSPGCGELPTLVRANC